MTKHVKCIQYPDCFNRKFHTAGIDGALGIMEIMTLSASDAVATIMSFYTVFYLEVVVRNL